MDSFKTKILAGMDDLYLVCLSARHSASPSKEPEEMEDEAR